VELHHLTEYLPTELRVNFVTSPYSYLKQHFTLPFPMTDAQFMQLVLLPAAGLTPGGKLNLERLTLTPILEDDDELFFDVLGARISPTTGLLIDATPPFLLYPSNINQLQGGVNHLHPMTMRIAGIAFRSKPMPIRRYAPPPAWR
jgi:hypothetical protein